MLPSDRPDDAVIEDDVALDKWYRNYVRDQAIKSGKRVDQTMLLEQAQIPQFGAKG
jgi:hypothetical protein